MTEAEIMSYLQEVLKVDHLNDGSSIETVGSWDSLAQVSLMLGLEQMVNIEIPPDHFGKLTSVTTIISFLRKEGAISG